MFLSFSHSLCSTAFIRSTAFSSNHLDLLYLRYYLYSSTYFFIAFKLYISCIMSTKYTENNVLGDNPVPTEHDYGGVDESV